MWLVVVHFACSTMSTIPHYCTVSTFHCPSQFDLKTECFCYVSAENCMQKYGQEGFFSLKWNLNKVINIIKLMQMIFSAWFGYSEYVDCLLCGITFIVLNVSIWLFTTSIWLWSIIQQGISSMKLHKLLLTYLSSHGNFINCTNLCVSVAFLPFLK